LKDVKLVCNIATLSGIDLFGSGSLAQHHSANDLYIFLIHIIMYINAAN